MRCPKCGAENTQGKIVCRRCGTRLRVLPQAATLVRETEEQLMTRVRQDAQRIIWVVAVVIAAGLVMGYLTR